VLYFKNLLVLVIGLLFVAALLNVNASAEAKNLVDEDKAEQVWKLTIEGNDTFSGVLIKDQIATSAFSFLEKLKFWDRSGHQLNETEIKKDVIRIRNFYNRRGFPNVQVRYRIEDGNKSWKKHVVFIINEQAPIRINDITFTFTNEDRYREVVMQNSDFQKTRRKSEFQEGDRYEIIKKPEVVASYEQRLKNLGFAYAKVSIEAAVDTAGLAANLTIKSSPGPLTYINNIDVKGDSSSSKGYIIRESGLKKGQKFSLNALQEAQREIFNHHLFRFATLNIPEQQQDSTLDLTMRVRENELRTVKTSVGFGTEGLLRGRVSWTHRNVFDRAHQFTASARASFIEQTVNLDYIFPYVFNTKSSFVVSPFGQHLLEPSFELFRLGVTNSLIYQYSRNLTGSVSYQFTRNAELSQRTDESLPDTTQNFNLSSIQLSGYYNQGFGRRSQNGWVVQPFAEVSGLLGSSTFEFQKLTVDVRRYIPLSKSTTLAARIETGALFAAKEDSLPTNIRFFLGGTNSVRGYGRHELGPQRVIIDSVRNDDGQVIADSAEFRRFVPVGGRSFFGFNFEIRQGIDQLIDGFGIAIFLDGGQVWRREPDLSLRPMQFAAGGGLRYQSPIGPVRLDVGYKLNPSDTDLKRFQGQDFGNAFDRIGIHISVGQAF
jgi:outer membrane protein insertion porin family